MRVQEKTSPWPFVGMGAMAAAFFLYAAAWSLAPWWVVVPNLLLWLVALVLCMLWWTPRPTRLPVVGGLVLAWWFVVYLGGGLLFSW